MKDPDRAWDVIQSTRAEAKKYRLARNDYKSKLNAALQGADDDEDEGDDAESEATTRQADGKWEKRALKAEKRLEDLQTRMSHYEQQVQQMQVRAAVADAASRLGFHDPGDVFSLVAPDLEIDEDGVHNLDEVLEALVEKKPYLLRSSDDSEGQQGRKSSLKVGGSNASRKLGEPDASFRQFMGLDPFSPFDAGGVEFPDR